MYFLSLFVIILINISFCLSCVKYSEVNCSPMICTNGTFENNCSKGVILSDYLDITVTCLCSCSRHWSRLEGHSCVSPRRHKLGCRFGGPRWGLNCWSNSEGVEKNYTAFEDLVAKSIPARMIVNFTSLSMIIINRN